MSDFDGGFWVAAIIDMDELDRLETLLERIPASEVGSFSD